MHILDRIFGIYRYFKYKSILWEYTYHDDVIKWKHFPLYWPFVQEIHRPPVNSPHKGQWSGVLKFSLVCPWINGWVNNHEAGDLRRHRAHYDAIAMNIDTTWPHNIRDGYAQCGNYICEKENLNHDIQKLRSWVLSARRSSDWTSLQFMRFCICSMCNVVSDIWY